MFFSFLCTFFYCRISEQATLHVPRQLKMTVKVFSLVLQDEL